MPNPDSSAMTFPDFLSQYGVSPLKFPTLAELASEETPSPPAQPASLFSMVGDPTVLFSDLIDDPGRYEDGVDTLLQQLMHKQKKLEDLNERERQLLNSAVVTFVQAPRRAPTPVPTVRKKAPEPEEVDLDEHGAPTPTEPDIPEAPAFWWKR